MWSEEVLMMRLLSTGNLHAAVAAAGGGQRESAAAMIHTVTCRILWTVPLKPKWTSGPCDNQPISDEGRSDCSRERFLVRQLWLHHHCWPAGGSKEKLWIYSCSGRSFFWRHFFQIWFHSVERCPRFSFAPEVEWGGGGSLTLTPKSVVAVETLLLMNGWFRANMLS